MPRGKQNGTAKVVAVAFSAPNGIRKATATHSQGRHLHISDEFIVGGRHKTMK